MQYRSEEEIMHNNKQNEIDDRINEFYRIMDRIWGKVFRLKGRNKNNITREETKSLSCTENIKEMN